MIFIQVAMNFPGNTQYNLMYSDDHEDKITTVHVGYKK